MEDWHCDNTCLSLVPITPAAIGRLIKNIEVVSVSELDALWMARGSTGIQLYYVIIRRDGQHWITDFLRVTPLAVVGPNIMIPIYRYDLSNTAKTALQLFNNLIKICSNKQDIYAGIVNDVLNFRRSKSPINTRNNNVS